MARVNANFIDYDSHYYRMIGEWDNSRKIV